MGDLNSEADRLVGLANAAIDYLKIGVFGREPGYGLEREHTLDVPVRLDGRELVITFVETEGVPAEYRYNARVSDAETGDLLATGNGGPTWEDAVIVVHWQKLRP